MNNVGLYQRCSESRKMEKENELRKERRFAKNFQLSCKYVQGFAAFVYRHVR